VARSLPAAEQPVRAVIMDRSKGAPWARLGGDVAIAELEDTGARTTAFEGTAGVFALLMRSIESFRDTGACRGRARDQWESLFHAHHFARVSVPIFEKDNEPWLVN
jgi:hypothetical protein